MERTMTIPTAIILMKTIMVIISSINIGQFSQYMKYAVSHNIYREFIILVSRKDE